MLFDVFRYSKLHINVLTMYFVVLDNDMETRTAVKR